MTDRFKFTKLKLEKLRAPADRVAYHYDAEVRGLRVGVHPSGRRTFSLLKKFRRVATTCPLGEFPAVSVEQARQRAREKVAAMDKGVGPRDELRGSLNPALGDFFERYLDDHTHRGVALTDAQRHDLRVVFDRSLGPWRRRALNEITRVDVEHLHRRVGEPRIEDVKRETDEGEAVRRVQHGGPVAANRLLALVSAMFTDARDWGVLRGDNPARGVPKFEEHARKRTLNREGELQQFLAALDRVRDADFRLYLKVRLMNGIRETNILRMRWADLNLGRAAWLIGRTKNGDPLDVPLSNPVLDELRQRESAGDWVFAGRRHGEPLKRGAFRRRYDRFRAALGLRDVQLRDLRRTFGSRSLAASVPMDVIAQMMGHRPGSKVTASIYALADEQLKREAISATTLKMLAEAKERKPALSRARRPKRLAEAKA